MVVQWQAEIGARICDMVASKETDRLYVATDGGVTVMDGSEIAARIPVGPDTKRLILGADEAYLYVPGYDGSVRIIDTADHRVTTSYRTPSTAEVVSPCGRQLYTMHIKTPHENIDTLIAVTTAQGTAIATVTIENYATGMRLSPDGGQLYVAGSRLNAWKHSPGAIAVIDTAHCAVTDTIVVPPSPDTVRVSPDGSRIFVTHYDTNSISVVDVERRAIDSVSLPDAPLSATVTPDSNKVYVIGTQSLVAVDFRTKIAEVVPAGEIPRRMQFIGDDGQLACVTDLASATVVLLDTVTNSVVTAVQLDGHPEDVALSGDGELLYVADYWSGTLTAISIPSLLRDAEAV
jgi:YVTN family beta-propeller protein